jgi:enamine deaminase RidA (YjgF/YER057c/UK114 family)
MWENLHIVLEAANCNFDDIVEMTSYHVEMSKHMDVFRTAKNEVFPKGTYAWTRIGMSELAHPGLLAEVKCIAVEAIAVGFTTIGLRAKARPAAQERCYHGMGSHSS